VVRNHANRAVTGVPGAARHSASLRAALRPGHTSELPRVPDAVQRGARKRVYARLRRAMRSGAPLIRDPGCLCQSYRVASTALAAAVVGGTHWKIDRGAIAAARWLERPSRNPGKRFREDHVGGQDRAWAL